MPVSKTGTSLPRQGLAIGKNTFLHVPYDSLFMTVFKFFAKHHSRRPSVVTVHVAVIEMRHYIKPRIINGPERKNRIIEIYQVGIITVNHVDSTVEKIVVIFTCRHGYSFRPVPNIFSSYAKSMILLI